MGLVEGEGGGGGVGGAQPQLPGFSVFASIALLQIRFLGIQFHSFDIKKYYQSSYLKRNALIDRQRHPNKKLKMRHTHQYIVSAKRIQTLKIREYIVHFNMVKLEIRLNNISLQPPVMPS